MIMKTPIHFNNKGNEIIILCSFGVGSCFFLNNHHCCMCCRRQCSLHHICASQVSNDKVHQNIETISSNKNIHSLLGVAKEKVGNLLLNMCFVLHNNNCNSIPKCVMGCCTFTLIGALKKMGN
jgi:hypothetical protein